MNYAISKRTKDKLDKTLDWIDSNIWFTMKEEKKQKLSELLLCETLLINKLKLGGNISFATIFILTTFFHLVWLSLPLHFLLHDFIYNPHF